MPETTGKKRRTHKEYQTKPGGVFKPGNPGRPEGTKNFTTTIREALEKVALEKDGKKHTYKDLLVDKIMEKTTRDGSDPTIKLVWNYLDGLPVQKVIGDFTEHVESPSQYEQIITRAYRRVESGVPPEFTESLPDGE